MNRVTLKSGGNCCMEDIATFFLYHNIKKQMCARIHVLNATLSVCIFASCTFVMQKTLQSSAILDLGHFTPLHLPLPPFLSLGCRIPVWKHPVAMMTCRPLWGGSFNRSARTPTPPGKCEPAVDIIMSFLSPHLLFTLCTCTVCLAAIYI